MRKQNGFFHILLFIILCCSFAAEGFTQAQWEFDFVQRNYHPYQSDDVWRGISNTAKPLAAAIPVGMFAVALLSKNKTLEINSYETAGGLAITAGATFILKEIIKRPRPYVTDSTIFIIPGDHTYSFPSGHVSVAAASAVSLIIATKKWYVAVPAIAWVACVGYSRIYMGEHYPTDVIAGAIVGTGGALAANWLNRKFFFKKKKQVAVHE